MRAESWLRSSTTSMAQGPGAYMLDACKGPHSVCLSVVLIAAPRLRVHPSDPFPPFPSKGDNNPTCEFIWLSSFFLLELDTASLMQLHEKSY